jgi:hypothetical protein
MRRMTGMRFPAGFLLICHVSAVAAPLTFEKDVRPILKANCFHCHGEEGETKGGLDVRLARFISKAAKVDRPLFQARPRRVICLNS